MKFTPDKIKHLRQEMQVTQTELAQQLGVNQVTIAIWENSEHDNSRMHPRNVRKLTRLWRKHVSV